MKKDKNTQRIKNKCFLTGRKRMHTCSEKDATFKAMTSFFVPGCLFFVVVVFCNRKKTILI